MKGKVVAVCPTEKVTIKSSGKVLRKRDCEIADSTAIYRCITWEDQIELFQENKSYKLSNATIRSFNGAKYLSLGEGCDVKEIEDIGEVIDDENVASQSGSAKVVKGEIVAVIAIDMYKGCLIVVQRWLTEMVQWECAVSVAQR